MAAPTPKHDLASSIGSFFVQKTSATADAWTDLITVRPTTIGSPAQTLRVTTANNMYNIPFISFHHTSDGAPIRFGLRLVNNDIAAGDDGHELILVYEDSVYSQDERMSDVDIIQGVDSKSCRKYNFSDIPFLQFNYTLQFYSSSASGFIVNAIVSPNMEIAAANIKTEV